MLAVLGCGGGRSSRATLSDDFKVRGVSDNLGLRKGRTSRRALGRGRSDCRRRRADVKSCTNAK